MTTTKKLPVLATLTITAPLPPKELSPNRARGQHWGTKSRCAGDYRRTIAMLAMSERIQWERRRLNQWVPAELARISLEFGIRNPVIRGFDVAYRPKDTDNAIASFKAGQDGLRDAGVIFDDDYLHLERGTVRINPETEGLVIRVEVLKW